MRIAIDYTAAVYQRAGIGRYVRGLVGGLAKVGSEHQYTLISARPPRGSPALRSPGPNFRFVLLPLTERWLTILWHRAEVRIPVDWLTGPVDLFHSPDFSLPPLARAPGIVTIHDLSYIVHPECAHPALRRYLERVVPRSVRRARLVFADSQNTRDDVISLLGVNPDRVRVVGGGVGPQFRRVTDEKQLLKVRNEYAGGYPYILTVGTIEPRKNLPRLMQAYALFKKRTSAPHKLVIAGGKGWLWEETFQEHERSPYRQDISMVGHVPDPMLPALYSAADLCAYPSLYEGFGLPPLEAMACGTPVLASNVSALTEVLGDGALLVDPLDYRAIAEGIERLLADADLRQGLVLRGLERALRLTWDAAARRALEAYQELGRAR